VRVNRINADAVDADPGCGSGFVPGPKLGQLASSTTREIEHIEKEDENLVLRESVGKCELISICRRKLEVRSLVSDSEHA
jgi:hypothetical protein